MLAPASAAAKWEWRQTALRELNGPPPVPITAHTAGDFNEYVRRLKIWAGDPPVRLLAKRIGVAASTLSDLLRKTDKLPNFELLGYFLAGCGVTDANVVREWLFAWRRIKLIDYQAPRQLRPRGKAA